MAEGEPKGGKDRPYAAPFLVAIVMWAWLSYLFIDPDMVERSGFTFTEWVTIGYLVTVLMLVVLLIWKITLNTEVATQAMTVAEEVEERPKAKTKARPAADEEGSEEGAEEAPPRPRKKKRVVVAAGSAADAVGPDDELPEGLKRPEDVIDDEVEDMEGMPRVVEYPEKEPGGVYSDTLLKVDGNLVLNYRILLGKVCHNCEDLDKCKQRVMGKLDDDIFLYNFTCKEGIKAELNRARKEREAMVDKAEAAKKMVEDKAAASKEESSEDEAPPKERAASKKKSTSKKTSVSKKKPPKKKGKPKKAASSKKRQKADE
jgi:hypothetical protein